MLNESEGVTEIVYPDGKTKRIDSEGRIVDELVVPDPFGAPYAAELLEVQSRMRPKAPPLDFTGSAATTEYIIDTSTLLSRDALASKLALEASADALQAIIRLRAACEQMISELPLRQSECLAFVEFAKQRLNVIATAVSLMEAGA